MADSNRNSSSSSMAELMDRLRERLFLSCWAGGLFLVLYAIYDLPTASISTVGAASSSASDYQPPPHPYYLRRGNSNHSRPALLASSSSSSSSSRIKWVPLLEEEARAIDMIREPRQYLDLFQGT